MTLTPIFYDCTLRDGNQSLKKPWNLEEKEKIFELIQGLKIPVVEAGFPASSEMDFMTVRRICEKANPGTKISALARTVEKDILSAIKALEPSKNTQIHTFITTSPFHMKHVLGKSAEEVRKIAVEAVKFIRENTPKHLDIEFSAEHFGDCGENLDFVIDLFKDVVKAGVNVINLPNTVERTRIKTFVDMVEKVRIELPDDVLISVHCHNDLGMATATTVESFFAGAARLECCLNGLGERAGNTNFYEVATVLHNCGINTGIELSKIYETALIIEDMSKIQIYEKAPLIGKDVLAHRSGIHQDGAVKTKDMEKGAYRPIKPSLIGRKDDETLGITSQSGKTAIYEIIREAGYPITVKDAEKIAPIVKSAAEKVGELSLKNVIDIYFQNIFTVKGDFIFKNFVKQDTGYVLTFLYKGQFFEKECFGNGPVDACINGLAECGFKQTVIKYEQKSSDVQFAGSGATALTVMEFEAYPEPVIAAATDKDTLKANIKAIFNGFNMIYSGK